MAASASSSVRENIRYMAVARLTDKVTIADYAAVSNSSLSHRLLEDKRERVLHSGRVDEHDRLTITDNDVGTIHFDCDPHCIYMVMTSDKYDQRAAFKFLNELCSSFSSRFASDIDTARQSALSKSSREVFAALCAKYNKQENVDKVASVAMQVDEVKGVMQDNIQSVLRNQENIETLLDQTDNMKNEATGFQRSANRAKEKMWWKNVKLQIVIVILVVILIAAIIFGIVRRFAGNASTDSTTSGGGGDNKSRALDFGGTTLDSLLGWSSPSHAGEGSSHVGVGVGVEHAVRADSLILQHQ